MTWEDRDELVWTQTMRTWQGKKGHLKDILFSLDISQEPGAPQGNLLEERKQGQFEDSGPNGERRQGRKEERSLSWFAHTTFHVSPGR